MRTRRVNRLAVVNVLGELRRQVDLVIDLGSRAVGAHARIAGIVQQTECRPGVTQLSRLASCLGLEVGVVARVEADCGNHGVSLRPPVSTVGSNALRVRVGFVGCDGNRSHLLARARALGRPLGDGGLRSPVASCDGRLCLVAVLVRGLLDNDFVLEDVVAQAEGDRRKVEVSFRRRIVSRVVIFPVDQGEWRRRNTILWLPTNVVVGGRIGVYLATSWLRRATHRSGPTAPS